MAEWLFAARPDGVGPDYCANCVRISAPCASGLPGPSGRLCPQIEHACHTREGQQLWDAVRRSSSWAGGGMNPLRIDRASIHQRLTDVPVWIIETLLDEFEPAALNARALVQKKTKKTKPENAQRDEPGSSSLKEMADD